MLWNYNSNIIQKLGNLFTHGSSDNSKKDTNLRVKKNQKENLKKQNQETRIISREANERDTTEQQHPETPRHSRKKITFWLSTIHKPLKMGRIKGSPFAHNSPNNTKTAQTQKPTAPFSLTVSHLLISFPSPVKKKLCKIPYLSSVYSLFAWGVFLP